MKIQKKIFLILCLVLIFALSLPQLVLANSNDDGKGSKPISYNLVRWGGPEMADKDSIRVYWGDFTTTGQQYRISWAKEGSKEWASVDVDDPGTVRNEVKSFLITGLRANQKYKIRICAILRNEKGEKTLTAPLELKGCTFVAAPEYTEPYLDQCNSEYLELNWRVPEKNALLKIYRSDAKNGKYQLIGSTDGRLDENHSNFRDYKGRVVYYDKTIKAGKSYYYKAVSELTLDDGSVIKAESPKSYHLTVKNRPYGSYINKLINKKGTYAKTLTWKLTSEEANHDTKLIKKNFKICTTSNKTGQLIYKKPVSIQYSHNGKKYYNMKKTFTLKPGKTVYLRTKLKNRMWIRKDGANSLYMDILYCYSKNNEGQLAIYLLKNGKGSAFDPTAGDYPEDVFAEYIDYGWEGIYQWTDFPHGYKYFGLKGSINKEKSMVLRWKLCPSAESYNLRYGSTEKAAKASVPVQIPKDQFAYEVKGLKENEPYYFFLSEVCRDENGKMQEVVHDGGQIRIPEGGWKEDYTYSDYKGVDLSVTVTEDKTVALDWNPRADGYKIQYGNSKEDAKKCEPIIITDGKTHHYEIKEFPKGLGYIIFNEMSKDENGELKESGWCEVNMYLPL